jgi:hypothetical protein
MPTPSPIIPAGLYPRRHDAPDGQAYFAAWLASDGSIMLCSKPNADAAWSTPAAIVDETGTALVFADGGFDFSVGFSGQAPLVLTATLSGETGPREWVSYGPGFIAVT